MTSYEPKLDTEDFQSLSEAINKARTAHFEIIDELNEAEREAIRAQLKHERLHRRALLASTEKTDAKRKAEASITTEESELKVVTKEQIVKEHTRRLQALRKELEMLAVISNNFRAQVK